MNLFYFTFICSINFICLIGVSVLLIYVFRKSESTEQAIFMEELRDQEERFRTVLDEVTNVTTLLYEDIERKKEDVQRLLTQVNDKITLLGTLGEHVLHAIPESEAEQHSSRKTTNKKKKRRENVLVNSEFNQKIYALYDQGFNLIQIAKIVGKPKGEIELIINLRDVAQKQAGSRAETREHETSTS